MRVPNLPPDMDPITDQLVEADSGQWILLWAVTDRQGDTMTVVWTNLPPWAANFTYFTADGIVNGVVYGSPTATDVGVYADVTMTVTDDAIPPQQVSQSFDITVALDTNYPPVLATVNNIVVREGAAEHTTVISATDPDSPANNLTLTVIEPSASPTDLPTWAVFTQNAQSGGTRTGDLDINTTTGDAGVYSFLATVEDDGSPALSDSQSFSVTVNANTAPVLSIQTDVTVENGATAVTNWTATDADGDGLTASLQGTPPSWVTLNDDTDGTGDLTAEPVGVSDGTYPVTLRITDDGPIPEYDEVVITYNVQSPSDVGQLPGGQLPPGQLPPGQLPG